MKRVPGRAGRQPEPHPRRLVRPKLDRVGVSVTLRLKCKLHTGVIISTAQLCTAPEGAIRACLGLEPDDLQAIVSPQLRHEMHPVREPELGFIHIDYLLEDVRRNTYANDVELGPR